MDAAFQQGFASALLDVLFNKVTDVFLLELKKIRNVDNAVEKLETTILQAQDLRRRVDISHFQGNDMLTTVVRNRVDTLTTLCYDVEDVMDEIALMIAKHNSSSGKKGWRVRDVILRNLTWTMPHAISKLQEKLASILEQLNVLEQLTNHIRTLPDASSNPKLETLSIKVGDYVKKSPLVGRDNDVQAVIELISCGSDDGVSMIGMNGLGKTALAQIIMNDAKIVQEFPNRLWAPVLKGSLKMEETINRLAKLRKEFKAGSNKKSLIIIDDLSEVKYLGWADFLSEVKAMGETKFLITTRDPKISKLTGTTPYYLRSLSVECCKSIILEIARSHNRELSGPRLSPIADILASKCEGLPLVARTIGLVLARYDEDKWDTLCKEDLWKWPVFKDEIYPVLNSSYEDMHSDMKNCFAFLSLFPNNYRFHTHDLVQLWVGAGFIEAESSKSWDEIGSDHLKELQGRSILQFCDDRQRFELHRFNHTFAQLAASNTCKRLDGDVPSALRSLYQDTRHLSLLLSENIQPTTWSSMGVLKRLCTLLLLNVHNPPSQSESMIPPDLFKKIQRLRVLALSNTVTKLPNSIKKLRHLRFLDVSGTHISSLPETLSKLHGLQILKFENTNNLTRLPKDLQKLTNLLFLDWDESKIRSLAGGVPCNIGKLESLQNLPLFQVGEKEGQSITELQNMNSLRGSIHIENLENVKGGEEAVAAKLHEKSSLKRIELQWNSTSKNAAMSHDVLEGLKPPDFVKELKIIGYGCEIFPQWLSHRFPMLEKIHLLRCCSCIVLPALQQLPALKVLILEDMTKLRFVDTGLCGTSTNNTIPFPSLKILEFKDMPNLQEWKGLEANAMPQLHEFKLVSCPKIVNFPSLENLTLLVNVEIVRCQALESLSELPTSLKSLMIRECPKLKDQCQVGGKEWLKIQSVPDVVIDDKKIPTTCAPNSP